MYSNFNNSSNRRRSGYKRNNSSYYNSRRGSGLGSLGISRRTRNRIGIIAVAIIALILCISMISCFFSCLCSGCKSSNSAVVETTAPSTKATKATKPTDPLGSTSLTFRKPNIEDDGSSTGTMSGSVYVWNDTAYELFSGSDDSAKNYATTINDIKTKLGSDISVFSMIVPNHTEMGLPERLKNTDGGVTTLSQAHYIKTAYKAMSSSVIPVNCYNALSDKCDHYIYFNSDHHWTGAGAYYAYTAFAEATKQKALPLSKCTKNKIAGFTGSFTSMVSTDLKTDTVAYWTFPYNVPTTITNSNGNTSTLSSCYYTSAAAGSNTYGVFLWGDNPLEVIKSSSSKAKDKILVVHESYGNAFIPYLTYNYKEVYSVDFRTWTGDLKSYCNEHGIKNVLFLNGVMSSATAFQVQSIGNLVQ